MNPRPLLSLLILTSATACAEKKPAPNGEVQPIARIQLDTNRVIEVIGLRRWTTDMIQDSLRQHAPGQTLDSANVASTLREKLHFADAAVDTSVQVFDENETTQITVGVREPQDSARVHYVPQTLDTIPRIGEWKAITARLTGADNARRLAVVARRHLDGPARRALPAIATAIARTGGAPRDARPYLAGGGEMLTAYIESANPDLSEPAHRLLVALRGSDLGTDPEPWRAWIRTL